MNNIIYYVQTATGQFRRGLRGLWRRKSACDRTSTDEKTGRRFVFCLVANARATGGGGEWRRRRRRRHVCVEDQKHAYTRIIIIIICICILLLLLPAVCGHGDLYIHIFVFYTLHREWELHVRIFFIFVIKRSDPAAAYFTSLTRARKNLL